MSGSPSKWTQIQVTNKKPSELQDLEINLEEDVQEENTNGNNTGTDKQANDRNADGAVVQNPPANQDGQVRSKVQPRQAQNAAPGSQVNQADDDDDSEQPQGQSRRARRIRFLSSRVQELENQLNQERGARQSITKEKNQIQANNVTQQAAFYKSRVEEKTSEYEKAVESNDPKAQAKALRDLNDAQINLKVYEAAEADVQDDDEPIVQQRQQHSGAVQAQQAPQAALKWVEKNKWFMTNKAAHLATRAVNEDLMREGYDPNSEDFYQELDDRLSADGLDLNKLRGTTEQPVVQPKVEPKKRKSPVGSSEGDNTGGSGNAERTQFKREGNKVLVTPTDEDREVADSLGSPIENYMQNKLIYEEHGGKGYIPIVIRGKR